MKKSLWLAGLGVVGALALTSCGRGSSAASTVSESEYVTALSKAIVA